MGAIINTSAGSHIEGVRTVSDGPEPNGTIATDAALFLKLQGWVKASLNRHSDWYREAEECFGFVAGRSLDGKGQWPGTSWDEMKATGRQPIEFNRVGPIVDAICGLEVNNRQEVKYRPRTQGDATVNERLSSLGEWARDEAHAEDEESEMFRNAVICGRGATETRLDFTDEPTGKIVVDCLDPLECGVDPAARKPSLAGRRYSWRYRDFPADEAKAMFPGVEAAALHANWARRIDIEDGGEGNKTDYPDETRAALKDDIAPKTVRVVQIEWWESESTMLYATPDADEPQEMTREAWELLGEDEREGLNAQRSDKRRFFKAFLGRAGVLEKTEIETFQIQWTTGRYDRNRGYHYGVVRPMRDPQMLSNKTLSQVLHILNTNAKGGLVIERGAFHNPRDAEKDWSNPSKTVILNDGGMAKWKERTAPQIPASLVQLQEFSLSSIRDVTGVSVEMLGLADRDQPASLEYQRRQSAMTILAGLFNSLRLYRKMHGKALLAQLKLLPPGVLVRVLIDPEQAQMQFQQQMMQWQQAAQMAQQRGQQPPPQPEPPGAEFMSSTKVGEVFDPAKFGLGPDARFDVIVDETPSSPNQKEATWAALQPFMDSLPPSAIPIALKYSPLPETAAKELGDAITEAAQGPEVPPEMQQAMQEGQERIAELEQENAALKQRGEVEVAKVVVADKDAETRRMAAMANIGQAQEPDEGGIEELRAAVMTLAENQQAIMRAIGGPNAGNQIAG